MRFAKPFPGVVGRPLCTSVLWVQVAGVVLNWLERSWRRTHSIRPPLWRVLAPLLRYRRITPDSGARIGGHGIPRFSVHDNDVLSVLANGPI